MTAHAYAPPGFEITLSKRWFVKDGHTYDAYVKDGGYGALKKVLKLQPAEVIDTVKRANLRGRGGAGFAAGVKWGFVPKDSEKPKYLVVNADESEPGTYKDRYVLARDPHMMLEGAAIAAYAIGAHQIYVYARGEFGLPYRRLTAAIQEAYDKGVFGSSAQKSGYQLECQPHRGAGAYICGEETALLESLEGKIGRPRLKPPFPAVVGAFGGPTIINNVETLACVPLIFSRGLEWFLKQGSPNNGGPKLICLSGHVEHPGVYEVPNGYPCNELLKLAGGVWRGRKLKAVIPGGSSTPLLVPKRCKALAKPGQPEAEWPLETDVALDFDNLKLAGSMFGSAGMMVLDDSTCMVRSLSTLANFYAHESCGQCTPCREGSGWVAKIARRIEAGQGTDADLGTLEAAARHMLGTTICPLADALAMPVLSFLQKFRPEFEEHIRAKGCRVAPYDVHPANNTFWEDSPR
ncbi:MAG: NADH-quinone oxidoreductase subunit NuoF [Deltaproteobacteria bacterium]|nr:NADH-quinone oxidoreductase subunit NuoF [Deltaproteobacteria bacterium]